MDGKSNEITAIPPLLELLDLRRALVSIAAMGCQKEIAKKIVAGGGDYLLVVKGNQEHLLEDVQATLERALTGELPTQVVLQHTTTEQGHGRQENRSYVVVQDVQGIRDRQAWPKLKTVGRCCSERTVKGKTTTEVRCFMGSRSMGVRTLMPKPCLAIGGLRTICIGNWTLALAKMRAAFRNGKGLGISLYCASWR